MGDGGRMMRGSVAALFAGPERWIKGWAAI